MLEYVDCDRYDPWVGERIDGKYRVDKILGEGAFGKVYKVRDDGGVVWALKLLKLWTVESSDRSNLMARFNMEYQTGQIASNYLVHSRANGTVKGNPYIVMDFVSGGDLLTATENGKVDLDRVASDILYGLRDLHSAGKVHRDLKPENVLVKGDGTALLTDFGISGDQNKRLTERGARGVPKEIFGTYAYMPPEQVNPKRGNATVLPTTDIFSFGVMMYQMFTMQFPFGPLDRESDLPVYLENGKSGRWNRELLKKRVGGTWVQLIEGCLRPDYRVRLQSVDAVLPLLPHKYEYQPASYLGGAVEAPSMEVRKGILLRIMQGEEPGTVYKLNDMLKGYCHIITMGRKDYETHNSLPIKEDSSSYVSRKHCTLEYDEPRRMWFIRDGQWDRHSPGGWKASLNGTYVNSSEVDSATGTHIVPGDIISIGDVKLRVEGY